MAVSDIVPPPGGSFVDTLAAASPDLLRQIIRGSRSAAPRWRGSAGLATGRVPAPRMGQLGGDVRAGDPEAAAEVVSPAAAAGAAPPGRGPWRRSWPPPTCWGPYPAGGKAGNVPSRLPSCPSRRSACSPASSMRWWSALRSRPLDRGPYTFCWIAALTQKVREGGRTMNVHALIATRCQRDGKREILALDVTTGEDGAGWLAFPRRLSPAACPASSWSPAAATAGYGMRSWPCCRRRLRPRPARAGRHPPCRPSSRRPLHIWTTRVTSWCSPPSPARSGVRSGAITRNLFNRLSIGTILLDA